MSHHQIPITDIKIPQNRQREAIQEDHIADLMNSIFQPIEEGGVGLINPITIKDDNTLVAGECRLKAISLGYKMGKTLFHAGVAMAEGHIPYIDFGSLSRLQQMQLEYVENAVRLDLSWQDNIKAIASLNELMNGIAQLKDKKYSITDLTIELYSSTNPAKQDKVSKSILLAKNLGDKDIAGAKSFQEAKKILAKKIDSEVRVGLAREVGKSLTQSRMSAINADCITWMNSQMDGQFDVILTDPPYGINAGDFGSASSRLAHITHEYKDDPAHAMSILSRCIPEFFRLGKAEAHLYLFCDIDHFHEIRAMCESAGWWTFRTPLVSVKREGGRVPWPENGPRRSYELCLFAVKGKKPVNTIKSDVFESSLTEKNMGHGAQKAVEAYIELLGRSVKPGDRVFDAFAGTGTIFEATSQLGCYAVGVEINESDYGLCLQRIQNMV